MPRNQEQEEIDPENGPLTEEEIELIKARRRGKNRHRNKPIVGRFQILVGMHHEGDVTYAANVKGRNIIDSTSDLEARFGREKFRRIGDGEEPMPVLRDDQAPTRRPPVDKVKDTKGKEPLDPQPDTDYDNMTIAQLRQVAEEDEIDLGGATLKSDIIAAIRSAGL